MPEEKLPQAVARVTSVVVEQPREPGQLPWIRATVGPKHVILERVGPRGGRQDHIVLADVELDVVMQLLETGRRCLENMGALHV